MPGSFSETSSSHTMTSADGRSVEVPDKFFCPITLNIMSEPVCNRAGFNYDRNAILAWLENSGTCPLTRNPLRLSELIPNRLLEMQIKQFRQEHGLVEEEENEDNKNDTAVEAENLSTHRVIGFFPVSETKHEAVLRRHLAFERELMAMVYTH
jgi:hypothetical protein